MQYQDLVFDLYGTLVDIHTEEDAAVWEKTAIFFGYYGAHYTAESLQKAFLAELERREAKAGQSYECYPDIPFEQVMESLFLTAGVKDHADVLGVQAAQLFRISSMEYIRLYPNVVDVLQKLRLDGCRLWLLSNAQSIFTAYEIRHLQLENFFDGIYLSSDHGCRKPDRRFYRALLEQRNLLPEDCLMIGNDRFTDIAGAQNAGMATLYMRTNLTPADQAAADESLLPGVAPEGCRHFEYEGNDWQALYGLLKKIHR